MFVLIFEHKRKLNSASNSFGENNVLDVKINLIFLYFSFTIYVTTTNNILEGKDIDI